MPNFYWNISNVPTLNVQNGLTVGYGTCTGSWIAQDIAVYDTLSVHGSGAGSATNYTYYWDSTKAYNAGGMYYGIQGGSEWVEVNIDSASVVQDVTNASVQFNVSSIGMDYLTRGMEAVSSTSLGVGATYTPAAGVWYIGSSGNIGWSYGTTQIGQGGSWGFVATDGGFFLSNNSASTVTIYYAAPL